MVYEFEWYPCCTALINAETLSVANSVLVIYLGITRLQESKHLYLYSPESEDNQFGELLATMNQTDRSNNHFNCGYRLNGPRILGFLGFFWSKWWHTAVQLCWICIHSIKKNQKKHASDIMLLGSSFLIFHINSSFYFLFQMGANHRIIFRDSGIAILLSWSKDCLFYSQSGWL